MELTHRFTVPVPVERAWATFTDLESVGSCFPGATVTSADDTEFAGTVKVKLGPIALQYSGTGRFVERDDTAHRAVLEAKGKDKRGNGTAGAMVRIALDPEGEGTAVAVTTDLAVTGKPAQFGRGVMQDVSDKLLQQFVSCIEGRFAETSADDAQPPAGSDDAPPAPEPGAAPATGSASARVPSPAAAPSVAHRDGPPPTRQSPSGPPQTGLRGPSPVSRPASTRAARRSSDDAVDLGAAALPVLARTYGPYLAAAAVGAVFGWLVGRR
ncbi:MAG: SRPBCC family protein [Dermatophilaceae bacterium]